MAIDAHQDVPVVEHATETRSAYERIGGGPAVKELVDRFYEPVLADKRLARYFTTDMHRLKWHQAALLTQPARRARPVPGPRTRRRAHGACASAAGTTAGWRTT